ncbi:ankyrin repeat protein [Achlya hypogyna]|uniref:Ankyrin repeat protein n=1 Tax=Achlya hypogyna TaxID=1202772 RepID=A0A1V9ZM44_ACHHY|nr:ankyrin repeat protein [Achlya hypogyna]
MLRQWLQAASHGDVAALRHILQADYAWLEYEHFGYTALHLSVWAGRANACAYLLAHGASVHRRINKPRDSAVHGMTPLHLATYEGHADVVAVLLDAGAALDALYDGCTCLQVAAKRGYFDIVELLVQRGAAMNLQDATGRTSLYDVAAWGYAKLAKLCVDHGANVNIFNSLGLGALYAAAHTGDRSTTEFLINAGANFHNLQLLTPSAAGSSLHELVGRLDQRPLHVAALSVLMLNGPSAESVRLLIEFGLAPTAQLEFLTALGDWATSHDQMALAKFCADWGVCM